MGRVAIWPLSKMVFSLMNLHPTGLPSPSFSLGSRLAPMTTPVLVVSIGKICFEPAMLPRIPDVYPAARENGFVHGRNMVCVGRASALDERARMACGMDSDRARKMKTGMTLVRAAA